MNETVTCREGSHKRSEVLFWENRVLMPKKLKDKEKEYQNEIINQIMDQVVEEAKRRLEEGSRRREEKRKREDEKGGREEKKMRGDTEKEEIRRAVSDPFDHFETAWLGKTAHKYP